MPHPTIDDLDAALRHHGRDRALHATVAAFRAFLASAPDVFARSHGPGHFTGSAWLVSADGERVLLTHHRKLDRWLQLGGHADGDCDLAGVALREAKEESGLCDLILDGEIFDLDRHLIPARGGEPQHWHYDVRYVVRAAGSEAFAVSEESFELAWRPIAAIAAEATADESLRRRRADGSRVGPWPAGDLLHEASRSPRASAMPSSGPAPD